MLVKKVLSALFLQFKCIVRCDVVQIRGTPAAAAATVVNRRGAEADATTAEGTIVSAGGTTVPATGAGRGAAGEVEVAVDARAAAGTAVAIAGVRPAAAAACARAAATVTALAEEIVAGEATGTWAAAG